MEELAQHFLNKYGDRIWETFEKENSRQELERAIREIIKYDSIILDRYKSKCVIHMKGVLENLYATPPGNKTEFTNQFCEIMRTIEIK